MFAMRRIFWLIGLIGLLGAPWSARAAGKTEVRLLLTKEAAAPGETVLAAVEMRLQPRWHTYWRNAGDIGDPPKIDWELPAGVKAGEIQWPVPEKVAANGFTNYVYHDQVLFLVPLTIANTVPADLIPLKAAVSWIECETSCVPGKANVQATLTVGPQSKPSADAALIAEWQKKVPQLNPALAASASWEAAADKVRALVIEWTSGSDGKDADFFPYASERYTVQAATEKLTADAGKVRLRKLVEKSDGDWPKEIAGLVVQNGKAFEATLPVSTATAATAPVAAGSLLVMLGFAFLGGLILNVMPCVLPVIALKILSFVKQSKESPKRVALLGMTYSVGVLVSFVVMAGVVIAIKATQHEASWGMQFQNPAFLVAMTILVTLVALNLFGLFEFRLGGSVMGAAGDLAAKQGMAGAFFNGVLATALATPCTAPFLAPALGFAFAQPAGVIVAVFLAIGLGLAFPYLVLSFQPGWLKFLPKPGTWMEKFKVIMGFPMLGTAVWMLSLTTPHFGASGTFWFGIFLVALALAAWMWGEFVQRGSSGRGLAMALSLLVVGASAYFVLTRSTDQIQWQPWSAATVEKLRAEGRPIFVDFTASWCTTCQANKKFSIEIPSVRTKLKEIQAVALLGDYTKKDDAITVELQRFSRAGVPLVLIYPKDPKEPPIVLPEVLTPSIVLNALDKAAGTPAKGLQGSLTSATK